jgi:hypothetical protein
MNAKQTATSALILLQLFTADAFAKENKRRDDAARAKEAELESVMDITALAAPQCFTSGSGVTFLKVCITERGNISHFEAPAGKVHLQVREGYVLCSSFFQTKGVHGFDAGSAELGWTTPTVSQPGGPGTLPLIITRDSFDGLVQLKQTFNIVPGDREISVKMDVKNRSAVATLPKVILDRYFDGDINGQTASEYDVTDQSVWGLPKSGAVRSNGLMLTQAATAVATFTFAEVQTFQDWNPNGTSFQFARQCQGPSQFFRDADSVGRVTTSLGDIAPGQTKSVTYRYHGI